MTFSNMARILFFYTIFDRHMSKDTSRFWDKFSTWKEAEEAWTIKQKKALETHPIRKLQSLPAMCPIVDDTRKYMKGKGLVWVLKQDKHFVLTRHILRHPFRHLYRYVRSLLSKNSYSREGALYHYGIQTSDQFVEALREGDSLLVLGFAYCHKPFECPSGRFSAQCLASNEHPVCAQCFIGTCINASPVARTEVLIVPTVNYIGRKLFEIEKQYPEKRLLFLMTACELMLEMFGDWANMIGVQGIGVRLEGRVCNTFRSFQLSEQGVKPGMTVVLPKDERIMLSLLEKWREIVKAPL